MRNHTAGLKLIKPRWDYFGKQIPGGIAITNNATTLANEGNFTIGIVTGAIGNVTYASEAVATISNWISNS